jgi:hypothetical protein
MPAVFFLYSPDIRHGKEAGVVEIPQNIFGHYEQFCNFIQYEIGRVPYPMTREEWRAWRNVILAIAEHHADDGSLTDKSVIKNLLHEHIERNTSGIADSLNDTVFEHEIPYMKDDYVFVFASRLAREMVARGVKKDLGKMFSMIDGNKKLIHGRINGKNTTKMTWYFPAMIVGDLIDGNTHVRAAGDGENNVSVEEDKGSAGEIRAGERADMLVHEGGGEDTGESDGGGTGEPDKRDDTRNTIPTDEETYNRGVPLGEVEQVISQLANQGKSAGR